MAYTKYSLTPANNTAAPPDGAPEGMLPSAVNDTMRDMMAQIRDVGDGVRDGTYTMTAPKITGGTITGVTLTGNTLTNPVITGATLTTSAFNGTVGATTASTGAFTTLSTSSTTTLSGLTASTALALDASKNVVSVTNTGTGNNVLSASPTLTGTIAGASLSLSSLTSGRVTYAGASGLLSDISTFVFDGTNLGVGTGSPTAKLDLGGNTALTVQQIFGRGVSDSDFNVRFTNGSAGTAAFIGTLGLDYANGAFADMAAIKFYRNSVAGELAFFASTSAASGTERMRLNSTGLGIGTSSPSSLLHLSSSGSTGQTITSVGTNVYSSVSFFNTTTGYGYDIGFGGSASVAPNSFYIYGGSTASVKLKLDASGGLQVSNTIGVGNTAPSTSGAGITFPATQSASSDANTLDDYEEGTWTPTIIAAGGSGSPTYASNIGKYTKIGNTVFATAFISFTKNTLSGGTLQSGGLPFAGANSYYPEAACYINIGTLIVNPLCQVGANSTIIDVAKSNAVTGAIEGVTIANLGSGDLELRYTVTYQVN